MRKREDVYNITVLYGYDIQDWKSVDKTNVQRRGDSTPQD